MFASVYNTFSMKQTIYLENILKYLQVLALNILTVLNSANNARHNFISTILNPCHKVTTKLSSVLNLHLIKILYSLFSSLDIAIRLLLV